MFKQSAVAFGRCAQDCLRSRSTRPSFLVRSHHLANFKNAGIQDRRLARPNESPKTLKDGSVGVIHVQGQESATLVNPMQRRFLNDLELQQNRWLKEEKKNQDDAESLTKQITMKAAGGDKGDACKDGKGGKDDEKKKKEAAEKKKCEEMAQKKKCEEAAKKGEADKKKAEAEKKKKEQEKKCKEMAEKEKCNKMAADAKKKEAEKKKKEQEKKCKEMAEKEKCKKLAEEEKAKKGGNKPKK
ncbi:hypothetical protein KR032_000807 [Drosophila birchii]|nr:hypothetical protein KR032_000807 [Drosophila birchii]